eukprot:8027257-Lingulodinium_polyedra.AAC.1
MMNVDPATDRLRTTLLQLEENAARDSGEREAFALKKAAHRCRSCADGCAVRPRGAAIEPGLGVR